jgi:hypothetical protein
MRIVLCFLATFITTLSFGQTTDEQQILAIETQITKLSQAGKFKDLAALFEKVCREDFMIINHTGESADKSTFLAQVDRERTLINILKLSKKKIRYNSSKMEIT